jgi:4-diphosphocytidyl-2-C-methyl-D-erythritol kinase
VTPRDVGPIELSAPAKLTLSLSITGRRRDGYHLLESEMVTLDLADTLYVDEIDQADGVEGEGVEGEGVEGGVIEVPRLTVSTAAGSPAEGWDGSVPTGPDNLVARALATVGRAAWVHVEKRVPPGAGLGGGSADAAAILRWAGCTDLDVAAGLGADVPFCVTGGRALVRGVGEEIEPLAYEDRRFTLLLVPFGMDTGAVYRAWDEMSPDGRRPTPPSTNDLEPAALAVEPRLARWRDRLREMTGCPPRLAGSGSTWFVEGWPEDLGIDDLRPRIGDEEARLVAVHTVAPLPPVPPSLVGA